MLRGFAMQHLLVGLVFFLVGAIFADPGKAQPVGGNVTGGNVTGGPATGGATTGGNATGSNVTGGNVTGGNVGVNVGEERRYTVEFATFEALDETGCDACGSDEVILIIRTADYAMKSSEYGDVDSNGDTHTFKRCAQPAVDEDNDPDWEWECDQKGKAPPFSFTIAAYENDGPSIFGGECWTDQIYQRPDGRYSDLRPPNYDFCMEEYDRAELIGKTRVEIKVEDEDLAALTAPGQSFKRGFLLAGGCDSTLGGCSSGGAPKYRLFYTVKRVPDATGGLPVNPNP